ncbi:oligopeptidase A, partial [Psychrobacter sp. 16-Bac2893]
MTSISSKLHLVDFADTAPSTLQQQVISAIDTANAFLDELKVCTDSKDTSTSIDAEQALIDIKNFDHINLALDRSWGILSHLNSVMSNDEIRHIHHELLPKLSAYGTRVGQHQPLFSRYQAIVNDKAFFAALEPARARAIELALRSFELSGVALPKAGQDKFAAIQSKL